MALFNRQKSQTISDLENYYANRNNSTARAWLMALLSLLVTVAVLAALFFGIRWIYRALTDNETTVTTTTQSSRSNDTAVEVLGNDSATNSSTDESHEGHADNSTSTSTSNGGVVTDEAASTSTPRPSSSTASNSSTTNNALPNTGTSEVVTLTLIGASVASGYYIARQRYITARSK